MNTNRSSLIQGLRKNFIGVLIISFLTASIQMPVHAALVTNEMMANDIQLMEQRDAISQRLLQDEVKEQLIALGVNPATVQARINSMSSAELSQLEGQLNTLPAGSGVLGAILIILVIFMLLDIAGVTDIFPGV